MVDIKVKFVKNTPQSRSVREGAGGEEKTFSTMKTWEQRKLKVSWGSGRACD